MQGYKVGLHHTGRPIKWRYFKELINKEGDEAV